jgi:hypothetical protein
MMNETPIAIQVQKYLGGIDYPASAADIVEKAESAGAPDEVLEALRGLPDREYDSPPAVSKALS